MSTDILIAHPVSAPLMAQLGAGHVLHRLDEAATPAAREAVLAAAGPVCTAMLTNGHVTLDAALLDRLPKLGLVSCMSAGMEAIDVAALNARGIALTNTSDALVDEVANTAVMLMLAARRQLLAGDAHVRSGDWGRLGAMALTAPSYDIRVGIVGLGNIGRAIARRCTALGQQVAYFGRRQQPDTDFPFHARLTDLAQWAEVLIVATPGGPQTEGLISAEVLAALGAQGTLVNIARGSVVDEGALIAALRGGVIASAGLDVFRGEPNPDPALTALPNVTLFPHHASGTAQTRERMARLAIDNLTAFLAGRPPLTPVNRVLPSAGQGGLRACDRGKARP